MNESNFFSTKPIYKEFLILDAISLNKNTTQRMLAEEVGISVALANKYLDELEDKKYLKRKHLSKKNIEYLLTKSGVNYKSFLNVQLLHTTQKLYADAKKYVISILESLVDQNIHYIALYGAGEVAEIILPVLIEHNDYDITVRCIFDDDTSKYGKYLNGVPIKKYDPNESYEIDAILISSFSYHDELYERLKETTNKVYKLF